MGCGACENHHRVSQKELALITQGDMMEVLLAASPAFGEKWEAFCGDWPGKAEDAPHYLALGEYAEHMIALLEANDEERLHCIFDAVERLHVEGDAYVREAVTVGLLEDLQNTHLHTGTEPEQLMRFLGPESLKWWKQVSAFWNGDIRALQDDVGSDSS